MIREKIGNIEKCTRPGFRHRGLEITRLESFSDAVFAFTVTLLIISLEVPKTFHTLMQAMQGFFGFSVTFATLAWVWHRHYLFFRRYGLQDTYTFVLNMGLLFVVLFYAFPLKFLYNLLYLAISGQSTQVIESGTPVDMITVGEIPGLFILFGVGFAAVFIIFALLYWHAWSKRDQLELNELERFDTLDSLFESLIPVFIGLLSAGLALAAPNTPPLILGSIYWLMPVFETTYGFTMGARRRKIADKMLAG